MHMHQHGGDLVGDGGEQGRPRAPLPVLQEVALQPLALHREGGLLARPRRLGRERPQEPAGHRPELHHGPAQLLGVVELVRDLLPERVRGFFLFGQS